MPYALPTDTDWVTCSWGCHTNRNPPSSEAGTDYGIGYGNYVYAVESGWITYVKTSNSNATGRVVEYALDDGWTTRSLHMSEIWVSVGQRVARGQILGLSGASGYGDNWYYGPHEHHTLWQGPAWCCPTADFERYVGTEPDPMPEPEPEPEPIEEEDDMYKPTVHFRSEGSPEWSLGHPDIGLDLEQHTGPGTGTTRVSDDGKVTFYRGFATTEDIPTGHAWARTHAKGIEGETSRTIRLEYIDIQVELSRVSVELNPGK